jgi:hypothetical protein
MSPVESNYYNVGGLQRVHTLEVNKGAGGAGFALPRRRCPAATPTLLPAEC